MRIVPAMMIALLLAACGGGKDQAGGDHAVAVNAADAVENEAGNGSAP